jgi:hypothetical protein
MRLYKLDEQRRPVRASDPLDWQRWLQGRDLRVRHDAVGPTRVSTLFLAMDPQLSNSEEPQLFETMVLGGPLSHERVRYSTWDEAEAGHLDILERVKSAQRDQ